MKISEKFYSIQGEGFSVGVPAYFVRLQGCSLMCGGPGGALMKQGKATWWCDSETVWRRGNHVAPEQVIIDWKQEGVIDRICTGDIHLIWTGGEPALPNHQKDIITVLDLLKEYADNEGIAYSPYNEIETSGTVPLSNELFIRLQQINCSAKLANSGMSEAMRIKPDVIKQVVSHYNGTFKFVISIEDDIQEIERDYIDAFSIPKNRVCIMPGVDNVADLPERTRFLFEMTKKYGYRGITRQHILAWDKVTGV